VVSAVHFSDLCEGLNDRGWAVTILTSNRYCRHKGNISTRSETIGGVKVERVWRPGFAQSRNVLRMLNSFWIQLAWLWKIVLMPKADAIIVGTDPQFSQFMLPWLKRVSPKSRLLYWSFDLYPEAVQAEASGNFVVGLANSIGRWMPRLYRPVDVMVDIGYCMRTLLRKHQHSARETTLVPWALSEPEFGLPVNAEVRSTMFGDQAKLGVLYSGTMGMAHEYEKFLRLARRLRDQFPRIVFAFSSTGNRMAELLDELAPEDTNINILPFASREELRDRLNAADIHLLSLRDNWAGIVVPSKFFGSLAAGKPLLYSGSVDSCIGRWIEQYDLGLLLDEGNIDQTAQRLIEYSNDPQKLDLWKKNAYEIYHERFSKKIGLDGWNNLLDEECIRQ
jgi:colanic acid biosynthesis glycosyl transferase WcaI